MRLVFDIETDGFLDKLTKVHCIEIFNLDTEEQLSFADKPGYQPLGVALELLSRPQNILIGHNIQGFDIPALQKVYPDFEAKGTIRDTLIMSRLMYTDLVETDYKYELVPNNLAGRHSLEAWGYRLKEAKGDFGKDTDWKYWSAAMQNYCRQDVLVNAKLYLMFEKQDYSEPAIVLEHEFARIMDIQMKHGINFDETAAQSLYDGLREDRIPLEREVQEKIPPNIEQIPFTPKVNRPALGYQAGVPTTKDRKVVFNPGSRQQIINYLQKKYSWEPVEFTKAKRPKCTADVLNNLPYPEAKLFARILENRKLCSQIGDGEKSWLKLTRDGKIYGRINHNGARTGRCTHSTPNLAQIPRVGNFKGEECRSLFGPPPGFVMVGCDAKGLELRNLAHYLHKYDGGLYAEKVLAGDIHTENQNDAGLATRDQAKTFIYAFNYGAGDEKLGSIVDPTLTRLQQRSVGTDLRRRFTSKVVGLGDLLADIRRVHSGRGYFRGLDGRRLNSVSSHSALNTVLQGAGSVIMKQATVIAYDLCGHRADPVLHVHDEMQFICKEKYADYVGKLMSKAIASAGEFYDYKIPLEGDYKIGSNWAETH